MNSFAINGLREEEWDAYTQLLRLKKATVFQLAKFSGIKRATLYRLLEDLGDKGLVSKIHDKKKHYYIAEKPEKVLEFVREQERKVKDVIPLLQEIEKQGAERPSVKFYEGREGIRNLYDAMLTEKSEIVGFTSPDMLFIVTDYHPTFLKKRIKLGIPARIIMPEGKLSRQRQKVGAKELRTVRIADNLSLSSTYFIAGKKVAMFSMKSWFVGVLVENKEIADGLKAIFEAFWQRLDDENPVSWYNAAMQQEELTRLLYKHRLRPDKRLGQHYLIDENVLSKIIEASDIKKDELVLEIGAGPGILTKALAEAGAEVLAVEFDRDFCRLLQEEYHNWRNVHVLCDDALRIDFTSVKKDDKPYRKIVANIPYQITNPLVRKILEPGSTIETAVLLIQKEVAERLTAKPGSSDRGILTIMVECYGSIEKIIDVPPSAFWPSPKVDSSVIKITRNKKENGSLHWSAEFTLSPSNVLPSRDDMELEKAFFWFVKQGFSGKRKVLSTFSAGLRLPKEDVAKMIAEVSIDPQARAEDLELQEWVGLFESYSKNLESNK